DGTRKAEGVGAAVTLHRDAVEAEERATVNAPRVDFLLQNAETAARQERPEPGKQRPHHGVLEILADLARRALGGLERDIAGKALHDHDIHLALADLVALDEAAIVQRQLDGLQKRVRLL